MRRFLFCVLWLAAAAPALQGQTFIPPEPEDLIIYQIMIDRFENGDTSNDNGNPRGTFNPSGPTSFHGGDLEGIRQRLPYIKGLGANGIWITPFVENVFDYHGYGAFDWFKVDPNFGDIAKLQQLVSEANAMGIAFYFDMVAGHQGDLIDSTDSGYPGFRSPPDTYNLRWRIGLQYPPPFNSLSHFHAHGHIGNFVAPEQELGELLGLDDLKTDTQFVRDEMFNIWSFWMEQTGVSGFRVDTVKHVDVPFWEDFLPRLQAKAVELGNPNFFTFGEIFGADDNFMRVYVGDLNGPPFKFDAALDFQYYGTNLGVFARADSSPVNIVNRLDARAVNLPGHHLKMPNFLDNHDVRRFLNVAADNPGSGLAERRRRLELGLAFHFAAPGPPIVYYGTEQAFDGGNDPFNREDMFDGSFESGPSSGNNFDSTSALYQWVSRLATLRTSLSPLRRGDFVSRAASGAGPGELVFTRSHNGQTILIALNTATSSRAIPGMTIPELGGENLVNALDPNETMTVPGNGFIASRTLTPQDAEIWVREADLPPLPAGVTAFIPADGEAGVDLNLASIVIRFSTPMNRATTEAAVSIAPALNVSPGWNAESTELTLTVNEALQTRTDYTVTVADTATTDQGDPLSAAASATWTSDRESIVLPPMPPAVDLGAKSVSIFADGSAADWPAASISANSATVTAGQTFLWNDARDDDNGPGSYVYPTDSSFTGKDADLDEFRFAYDANNFYFLFRAVELNPSAGFFTPYFGVAIDLGSAGVERDTAFDQANNVHGVADLLTREDAEPDYELVFTGPRGATLLDAAGNPVGTPPSAFSQTTGVVEIAVPRADLGLSAEMIDQPFNLFVYAGLETFGSLREVAASNGQWIPGGGNAESTDPDIFDLAGASLADQQADLSNFDNLFRSVVANSVLALNLSDAIPVELSGFSIE